VEMKYSAQKMIKGRCEPQAKDVDSLKGL